MSLKQAAKERLLWAIRQVVVPFGRFVMLVDHNSLRIISACCTVSELMDEGIDLVELVTKRRQPLKRKNALYMISDEPAIVEILMSDFDPGHEIYKAAFVMFICHLYDDVSLRKIAESVEIEKILGCTELHFNFLAYEERVFHGNLGLTLLKLYKNHDDSLVHKISSLLASFCSTMRSVPKIRYQKCDNDLVEKIAQATSFLMKETLTEGAKTTDDELIILDRSIDTVPLFIHEYTYQAFIYDLLKIPCCSDALEGKQDDVWEFEYLSNSGKKETRKAVLSVESDELWRRFRHMHIQKVNETVAEEVEKVTAQSYGATVNKASGKSEELLKVLRELPKAQYMVEKYWAHLSLTEKSFEKLDSDRVMQVGTLEQNMATNIDQKGNKLSHSKTQQSLIAMVTDVTIDVETKMRLIMLYFSVYRNLESEHHSEILRISSMDTPYKTAIEQLLSLDLGFSAASVQGGFRNPRKIVHKHAEKGDAYQYYKKYADSQEYELSRYVPEIRHIVTRIANGTLEEDKFPTIEESISTSKKPGTKRDRIFIYIVGGITFSEMRVIYELASARQADIYIGGDTILVPSQLVGAMTTGNATAKAVSWKD